jgi:hypothetical protein
LPFEFIFSWVDIEAEIIPYEKHLENFLPFFFRGQKCRQGSSIRANAGKLFF